MKLSSHPGEVALPGGKMDDEDVDDSATALREAMEEIGLDQGLVRVVANLDPFVSSNLLMVVPVVGLLSNVEDFKPVLNADEVDAIFDAPLEMFLQEDGRHKCLEKEWEGWKYACHVFELEAEQGNFVVGGLTASILIQTASIIYQRSPSFNLNLPDFSQLQSTLNLLNN
ncbi:nudix hydrolase 15 mitochondrial [Phtheirospermum japonicum]|uniref:Nudix hydrolase 15 mitochondrial n=1 Tax=Phtheirospermum japonicum TaxID=374723 RepID=A0A830C0X3_9LAMI|nr:nudix hydrolase 15 mitochondrial [Phtheirospermum japonicum]